MRERILSYIELTVMVDCMVHGLSVTTECMVNGLSCTDCLIQRIVWYNGLPDTTAERIVL